MGILICFNATAQSVRCWDIHSSWYPVLEGNSTLEGEERKTRLPLIDKGVVPNAVVTESDVAFAKRTWSVIDLKDSDNKTALIGPSERKYWSLWTVIRFHLEVEPDLTFYEPGLPNENTFNYPVHPSDTAVCSKLHDVLFKKEIRDSLTEEGEPFFDAEGHAISLVTLSPILTGDIVRYYVKEDWFFDKKRSVLESRIIGIAPAIERIDEDGNIEGVKILFWLYYPQLQQIINQYPSPISEHRTNQLSFTDAFRLKKYRSVLIHTSSTPGGTLENFKLETANPQLAAPSKAEYDLWDY